MPLSTINSNSFSSTANTSVDNGTFNIDVTNNRVGINRSNPNAGFEVANSAWRLATYSGAGAFDGGLGGGFNPSNSIYSVYCRDRTDSYWNKLWIEANTIDLKSGNGSFAAVSCDASGRVTMPYQPAYVASFSSGSDITVTSGSNLPANSAYVNRGSHYNTSTYRFTAPVAGIYQFGASIMVTNATSDTGSRLTWTINDSQFTIGADIAELREKQPTGSRTVSGTILLNLNANDYVSFRQRSSVDSVIFYTGHSWIYGYLIG